ncbi:MAG: TatD family hydrolase [Terriglobales bacterium]
MFIDSHAHLEMEHFDADRAAVLERAHAAGLSHILAIGSGTGPGSLDCAIKIAEEHPGNLRIFATVGIHPHEAKLATEDDFRELAELAKHPKVIAWGEIGLDYYYDHSPREVQQEVFIRQMTQASEAKLPIVIHCRPSDNSEDAWDETLALLSKCWAPTKMGGILHCFTGSLRHAEAAVDMGFLISFSGNVTFPKAANIREAAQQLPLNNILIETDSPFLAPVPNRGKRNEPGFVVKVAEKIAEVRGIPVAEVAQATSQNFFRLFPLTEKAVRPV